MLGAKVLSREAIVALMTRREDGWRRRDADALAADHAPDAIGESPLSGKLVGRDRLRQAYQAWFTAFPDIVMKTEELLIDGHRAVRFFTVTGTQAAPFGGVPSSGRRINITGAWLYTLDDEGQIVHDRRVYDVTTMLVQLGALRTKPVN